MSGQLRRTAHRLKPVLLGGERAGGLEHLFGTGADAEVVGQIDPADCTGRVDEEFGGTRYVMAVYTCSFVEEVVAADYFRAGVGEECVVVARLTAKVLGLAGSIDTDGDRLDA